MNVVIDLKNPRTSDRILTESKMVIVVIVTGNLTL